MGGLTKEDEWIELIDAKDFLFENRHAVEKLNKGHVDVPGFLKEIAPGVLLKLAQIAMHGSTEKARLTALQDLLDRAGYSKVEKHAIANIDPSIPQEQLISMLEGIGKKTGAIEIED